jgi:hypothetical protein
MHEVPRAQLPLFEIVERNADGAVAVDMTPQDEPVLGLFQFRLGNHELKACRNRYVPCDTSALRSTREGLSRPQGTTSNSLTCASSICGDGYPRCRL